MSESESQCKFPTFGIWDKVTVKATVTSTVGLRSPNHSRHAGLRSGHDEYMQNGHYPPRHTMEFNKEAMTLVAGRTTVPMLNVDNNIWFRGNDCASALSYKDPKRAIKRHVDPEWQQTLEALLQKGGTPRYPP